MSERAGSQTHRRSGRIEIGEGKPCNPGLAAHSGTSDAVTGAITQATASTLIEVPDTQQIGLSARDLCSSGSIDLGQTTSHVPDTDLVNGSCKETCGNSSSGTRAAYRGERIGQRVSRSADRERAIQDAIQIEIPCRAIVCCRGMMPCAIRGDNRCTRNGMIKTRSCATLCNLGFLEVCYKPAGGSVNTEEVVDIRGSSLGLSAAFSNERDSTCDAARTSASANSRASSLEPQLYSKRRASQLSGST